MDSEHSLCEICKKSIKKSYLHQHTIRFHRSFTKNKRQERAKISCSLCNKKFIFRSELRVHVNENHEKLFQTSFNLKSMEEFNQFLTSEEERVKLRFIRSRQKKIHVDGTTHHTYYCQYDNSHCQHDVIPHEKRKRVPKQKGTYKLKGSCPASIDVEELKNGSVNVIYYITHVGHDASLVHLRLSLKERQYITGKLKAGVSFDEILNGIKRNRTNDLSGIDFITKKTIHNIAKSLDSNNSEETLKAAHSESIKIIDSDVQVQDNCNTFIIKSQSQNNTWHTVNRINETCKLNCKVLCHLCGFCEHIFSCTCDEYRITCKECKHIHKIAFMLRVEKNTLVAKRDRDLYNKNILSNSVESQVTEDCRQNSEIIKNIELKLKVLNFKLRDNQSQYSTCRLKFIQKKLDLCVQQLLNPLDCSKNQSVKTCKPATKKFKSETQIPKPTSDEEEESINGYREQEQLFISNSFDHIY